MKLMRQTCLLLAVMMWCLSIPLRCTGRAALVGGIALLDGCVLGACLAMVTRSRRPWQIYLWLVLAASTFWPIVEAWPFVHGWPVGDPGTIFPWRGAPDLVYNYYDILRACLFLLGFPYPFARLGQHGPDPLSLPETNHNSTNHSSTDYSSKLDSK